MKKRSILVLLVAALTIGNAVPAAAAPYGCGRNGRCGSNYTYTNGDGICDNFVDADGDGVNDNCPGYGTGKGQNQGSASGSVKKNTAQKTGTTKSIIKKAQKRLNKLGYHCGKANGIMNAKTKNAVKKFKKSKKQKANSVLDKPTLKALQISK